MISQGPYRYLLWRDVAPLTGVGTILFVMLNPSTADATEDDPTIRRVVSFASSWGYRRLEVVNLFAYRATDPKQLLRALDPVGAENDRHIEDAASRADEILVAWGSLSKLGAFALDRRQVVLPSLASPSCLGTTLDGQPRHPLYLSKTVGRRPYTALENRHD